LVWLKWPGLPHGAPSSIEETGMKITPTMAKELLKLHSPLRPEVDERFVQTYAEEMKNGRWRRNSEPIRLLDGYVEDGSRRLAACVKAGTPFEAQVIDEVRVKKEHR
jgi:hypothetical protein